MTINLIDQHKNEAGIQVSPCRDFGEGVAEAAITPGMVVTRGTAAGQLIADDATGNHSGIALENMQEGAATLRTAFAIGERVRYGREPGFKFMGLIASGANLAKDTLLMSNGAGRLVAWVGTAAGTEGNKACARIIQEGGTGGALGADGHFLCKWGVDA